ncbi:hypothetical protein HK12_13905 [Acetobacter orientalis]|uniref:Uncharacterized protein n=1 Tax=Acetobacter orientalis TaxID=146474 RepID=A0A252A5H1_9PROT|nr:hypothetical protein HK12_13905 [Acetobacter orientalis]
MLLSAEKVRAAKDERKRLLPQAQGNWALAPIMKWRGRKALMPFQPTKRGRKGTEWQLLAAGQGGKAAC